MEQCNISYPLEIVRLGCHINIVGSGTGLSAALCVPDNDLTIEWQNLMLNHRNATLAPQARQARASAENLNYVTLAPHARQAGQSGNFELLAESLV